MRYTIFSIDERRRNYTDAIRLQLGMSFWWQEISVGAVNGLNHEELSQYRDLYNRLFPIKSDRLRVGQLGIWYTVINALRRVDYEPLVTFEDDAILHTNFNSLFWTVTDGLPKNTDAFALFLPRDQDSVWSREMNVNPFVCRAYQRYGGVSMLWTPRGAGRFINLINRDGITDQWDDQLYKYARSGEMNVYTQPPTSQILVSISGKEDSIVQESELL